MNFEMNIERLEAYTNGRMDEIERNAFENELSQDTELAEMLDLYLDSEAVIEQGIANDLRSQLEGWAAEEQAPATEPMKPATKVVSLRARMVQWSVAASVLLVVGWFGLLQNSQQYSDNALYSSYYEMPDATAVLRGNATEHPLAAAAEAMEASDYKTAESEFRNIAADSEYYAQAQYYLGHTALQQQQYDAAISAFRTAADQKDMKVSEKADWHLVLTYLAAKRTSDGDFEKLLTEIINNSNHSFHEPAKALQAQLGDFRRRMAQ